MIKPVSQSGYYRPLKKSVKHFFNLELIKRSVSEERAKMPWLRPYNYDIFKFDLKNINKIKYYRH